MKKNILIVLIVIVVVLIAYGLMVFVDNTKPDDNNLSQDNVSENESVVEEDKEEEFIDNVSYDKVDIVETLCLTKRKELESDYKEAKVYRCGNYYRVESSKAAKNIPTIYYSMEGHILGYCKNMQDSESQNPPFCSIECKEQNLCELID